MSELVPDVNARHDFLDALFERTPFVEQFFVSRFPTGSAPRTMSSDVGAWDVISARVDAKPFDTYFGVASRQADYVSTSGTRGGKDDVGHLPAFFLDLDVMDHPEAHKNAKGNFETREDAHAYIAALKLAPSCIVDSGHGLQAYYFLSEPLGTGDAAILAEQWKDMQPRIQQKLYGAVGKDAPGPDPAATGDSSRVLRLPETPNTKTTDKVDGATAWCHVIEANYHLRYTAEQVIAAAHAAGIDPPVREKSEAKPATMAAEGNRTGTPSKSGYIAPTLTEFLNGTTVNLPQEARDYLALTVHDRRMFLRDKLVEILDWDVMSTFQDEYGDGYQMRRPGGTSPQSASIGGCVPESTDWKTMETREKRCLSDAMTVWSSAAEPFSSTPEAAAKTFPTFDGIRILQLIGVIPEGVPIKATFDAEHGHTYSIDQAKVELWSPSTRPTILMPTSSTFEHVDLDGEAGPTDHGEFGPFKVEHFPPAVVAEAKRRFIKSDFLSPIAVITQVWAEAVVACSGADVVALDGDGDLIYRTSMNQWLMVLGETGSGKDGIVSNLTSNFVGELLDEYSPYFPMPNFPQPKEYEEPTAEEEKEMVQAADREKKMRKALTPRHGSIVMSAKSPEAIATASSRVPIMVIATSEGAELKTAFGMRFVGAEVSSIAIDFYDVKGGKNIAGANQSSKDDRFSSNSALTIIGAVQPSVGGNILCSPQGKEIGLTSRFDVLPLKQRVHGFDSVAPMKRDHWRRMIGLLLAGFYRHANNGAKLESTDDGGVRVQDWGRTEITCTPEATVLYDKGARLTRNSEDSSDLDAALRGKRARKALGRAGVWACLAAVEEFEHRMKPTLAVAGVVTYTADPSQTYVPIIAGNACYVAGSPGTQGMKRVPPRATWKVSGEHFRLAWDMTEIVEDFTLKRTVELEGELSASQVKVKMLDDIVKSRSLVHAEAREKGERITLDAVLRVAYEVSRSLVDEDGWFPASTGEGPTALRTMVRHLNSLDIADGSDIIERKKLNRKNYFRFKVALG